MNIFLIGPMGAGKSSIGRQLAKELRLTFYDSDTEIETRTGIGIPWIFDVEGEAGFRKREERVIADLTKLHNIVLATGGGVVLSESNRQALAGAGKIIYLDVSLAQQLTRIERDRERRPLANTDDLPATLQRMQALRHPLYQMLADWTFNTDNLSVRTIVQAIIAKLQTVKMGDQ